LNSVEGPYLFGTWSWRVGRSSVEALGLTGYERVLEIGAGYG
jgi:hypothetical protein